MVAFRSLDLETARQPRRGHHAGAAGLFVSVIVPHYNDLDALRICVASLLTQTWPREAMEIIVVDNNSACGIDAVIEAVPGCRVEQEPVQGAGPARNRGVAASRGEIIAFIDSDCQPASDWIEQGVRGLADYDFMGGHVITAARNPDRPTSVEAWEMVFGFNFERHILHEGYTGSGNMWVWRDVFNAVGGFRSGISEDMDWSFRATAAGYRLGYEPKAIVTHLARASWKDLLVRWRRVLTEHYALTKEKRGWPFRWLAWTVGMPASVLPHSIRVLRSGYLPDWRSRMQAIGILLLHRLWRTGFMIRLLVTDGAGQA